MSDDPFRSLRQQIEQAAQTETALLLTVEQVRLHRSALIRELAKAQAGARDYVAEMNAIWGLETKGSA